MRARILSSISLIFVLGLGLGSLAAESARDHYQRFCEHLDGDAGMQRAALAALQRTRDPRAPFYVALARARWAAERDQSEAASAALAGAAAETDLDVDQRLELARVRHLCGAPLEALSDFDAIGSEHEGLPRVHAAAGAARVHRGQRRYDDALRWIDFALETLRFHDRYDDEVALRKRLQAERDQIRRLQDLVTHGLGFVLYRRAQVARQKSDYDSALAVFDELLERAERNRDNDDLLERFLTDPSLPESILQDLPISPVYGAAAGCYRLDCLAETGAHREAVAGLRRYIQDDPHGLYRCEARRLLGDIALDHLLDAELALRFYSEAIDAIATARRRDAAFERYAVPMQSREATAPPERMRSVEGWGNVVWAQPEPADVINRQTCPWYLDREELTCITRRALCWFILGKRDRALADIHRIPALDELDRALTEQNQPSNFLRLRDGFKGGRLFARPEELALFDGKARVALVIAELEFETERWPQALEAYRRVLDEFGDDLSEPAKAYLAYARACALIYLGKRDQGRELLVGFDGPEAKWAETPTWDRGMAVLGDYEKLPQRMERFELLHAMIRDPERRLDVMFKIGQLAFALQDESRARAAFAVVRDGSDAGSARYKAAVNFISYLSHLTSGDQP